MPADHAEASVVQTGVASRPAPAMRGSAFVLCQELAGAKWFDEVLALQGWQATCVTSLDAARNWLRVNRPAFMIVTGEYGEDTITALRACRSANVVWMTLAGPLNGAVRGDGVFEVTAFSQRSLGAAMQRRACRARSPQMVKRKRPRRIRRIRRIHRVTRKLWNAPPWPACTYSWLKTTR
jgi:two-component system capsular synthesis sensor histidine kinase RcsC